MSPQRRIPPEPLLSHPADLLEPEMVPDRLRRLACARVMFVDHAVVQRDFPRLSDSNLGTNPAIARLPPGDRALAIRRRVEDWFLAQASFVSVGQAEREIANSPIAVTGEEKRAWRPPRYGRAAVVQADDGPGLLDLKGIGVGPGTAPTRDPYGTGLLVARLALQELLFQWMIDAIFERAAPDLWTVPVYGIIDPGYLAFQPGVGEFLPAAILVRRGHRRPVGGIELPRPGTRAEYIKFEVEMLLRSYGLTSASASSRLDIEERRGEARIRYGGCPMNELGWARRDDVLRRFGPAPASFDGVNVQLAEIERRPGFRAQLVDFGQFEYHERFERGVTSLVYSPWLAWGGVIRPGDPNFVQSDPSLRLPPEDWSTPRLKAFLSDVAWRFHRGDLSGEDLRQELQGRVSRATSRWDS